MRKIPYFEDKISAEEYIKIQICKNGGTQSFAFKDNLIEMCKSLNIPYNEKMTKEELFDILIENGCEHKQLAEKFRVGISGYLYKSTFNISQAELKRLEKHNAIKVVGEYRFRAYGRYNYAPLYDIYQYANMSDEDMKNLLVKFPKGKRLTQIFPESV